MNLCRNAINPVKFLFESVNSFISPRICEICERKISMPVENFESVCSECLNLMPLPPDFEKLKNEMFEGFPAEDLAVDKVFALMHIRPGTPWFSLIYSLKYRGISGIGFSAGRLLGSLLVEHNETDFDAVIPVPIHRARRRERGYNQSDYIADGISSVTGLPSLKNTLIRTKYTSSQTKLSAEERKSNVSGVFRVKGSCPERILLVDDVLTTGATLNACAEELLDSGALTVSVAALAKA